MEGAIDILAAIAAGVGIAWLGVEREFSRQHHAVPQCAISNKLAHHLFAFAAGVAISCVDEVAALLDVTVE